MVTGAKLAFLGATIVLALASIGSATSGGGGLDDPRYASGDRLAFPARYRDWIFLSSGMDMSYSRGSAPSMHMFENVFVNPASYVGFVKSGVWPDRTTLVTEFRTAQNKGSINRDGRFQTGLMGYDIHVKDEKRFPGKWAFFGFNAGDRSAAMIPRTASCYACHSLHAAADYTFVQFYPTLLPIATRLHTLSAAFVRENRTGTTAGR